MPDTYEEFSEQLSDILSSGSPFGMAVWHEQAIARLIDGMDRDSAIMHFNLFYASENPEDLREGELSLIAELLSNLDRLQPEVNVDFKIVFE